MSNNSVIEKDILIIKCSSEYLKVAIKDIIFCEAAGSYTKIYFSDGSSILICRSLLSLEQHLCNNDFLRCHYSFLVNLLKVEKFNRKSRMLTVQGKKIPVSRRKYPEFMSKFKFSSDHLL